MLVYGLASAQVPVVKLKKDTIILQSSPAQTIQLQSAGTLTKEAVWPVSAGNMITDPQRIELFTRNDFPQQLTVKFKPGYAGNKTMVWNSENTEVASVSGNGLVTGKKKGSTRIMVITSDHKDTAVCHVVVTDPNEWGNCRDAGEGLIGSQNNWIYFANPKDEFKLYKMNFSGLELKKLSEDSPSKIQVMGRWIYFNCKDGVVQMTIDGGQRRVIDNRAELLRVHHSGTLYCSRENKVFTLNLNKPNQTMEVAFEDKDPVFNITPDQYYMVYNKYWENYSGNHELGGAYRYNWASKKKEELIPVKHIIRKIAVEENSTVLYYFQAGSNTTKAPVTAFGVELTSGGGDPVSTGMYTTTYTNHQRKEIPQIKEHTTWRLINDWVYYNHGNEWRRVKSEGVMDQGVVNLSNDYELYPYGDFLLVYSPRDKKIYRMLPDGRDLMQIF